MKKNDCGTLGSMELHAIVNSDRSTVRRGLRIVVVPLVGVIMFVTVLQWPLPSGAFQPATYVSQQGEQLSLHPEMVARIGSCFSSLAVSSGGLVVTSSIDSSIIHVLDIKNGSCTQQTIGDNVGVGSIAISSDGNTLAVVANGGTITNKAKVTEVSHLQFWDLRSRRLQRSIALGRNSIFAALFDPARNYVYCEFAGKGKDKGILGVNANTGLVETVFGPNCHGNAIMDWQYDPPQLLATSHDGKRLVFGTWMRARVWNLQTAMEELSCPLSTEVRCMSAAVSPDGTQLATGGDQVEVWDLHTGRRIAVPASGMKGDGGCLRFSPDGSLLASGADVGANIPVRYIQAWRVADYSKVAVIRCETSSLMGMHFLSGTNKLICGISGGRISVWDLGKLKWREDEKVEKTEQGRKAPGKG